MNERRNEIEHVVWDWNGTLLDDVAACVEALNGVMAWRQLPPVDVDAYRRAFVFPVQDYYRQLGLPCEGEVWSRLTRVFHEGYAAASRVARLRDGIPETLTALRRRAVPMSVLSACEQSILERMIRERGLDGSFRHVRGLDNLDAHSKLELGRTLMRDLAVAPQRVLLVGDTDHDSAVAAELGCACLLLSGGHQSAERLRLCACPLAAHPSAVLARIDQSPQNFT
jgi:phosphoglycolate phosphatase